MLKASIIVAAIVGALVALVLAFVPGYVAERSRTAAATPAAAIAPLAPTVVPAPHAHSGFLYGRITLDEMKYEGRLRWGGDQEAFWSDFFDGAKSENRWAAHWPQKPSNDDKIEIFGFKLGGRRSNELQRRFLARFGDIARIDAHFADVQITLKSGTRISLDRFEAGDIDDGVKVWDVRQGTVDVDARKIRTIEFLPTPPLTDAPGRLHGVVRTRQGEFTGLIQWSQQDGVSTDTLDGRSPDGELSLRYDTIRSIARQSRDDAVVTLLDGRMLALSDGRDIGRRNRGIYVDDARYGRVLVLWDAFERVDFTPGDTGPAYSDFSPGRHLSGSVTTRDGRRLAGRLVYDFDESETTETLDVSFEGVDYAIPLELVASIVPPGRQGGAAEPGRVMLRNGQELRVERSGDVADRNAGLLIFVDGRESPEYVPWPEVEQIDFDRPADSAGDPPAK
jgi:hypothetical protein